MSRLFAGFPRRRVVYAVAIVPLGAFLALLLAFPAPRAFIETEIDLQAWNREGGAAASVGEGRGFSLARVADEEA